MIVAPSLILLPFNPALAFFLFLGAFIYVVVYTLWLKPRTTLNIVIGGAAGSTAVLNSAPRPATGPIPPRRCWLRSSSCGRRSISGALRSSTGRLCAGRCADAAGADDGPAGGGLGSAARAGCGSLRHRTDFCPRTWFALCRAGAGITAVLWWAGVALVIDPSKRRAYRLFHVSNFYLLIILLAVLLGTLIRVP